MGESTGREAALALTPPPPAVGELGRLRQPCSSQPSSSASSSSGRRENQRRRRSNRWREAVVRVIGDRLPAAPSCWGDTSVIRGNRGRRRRERPHDVGRGGEAVDEEDDSDLGTARGAPALYCCLFPEECFLLEPNPSANGKEDAGVRSMIESNEFYSADCNPHAAATA